MKNPYHISEVTIENIRGFDRIHLDLNNDQKNNVSNWNLILGDNGVGKTTFLRCLAIALGDREHASALLRDSQGDWLSDGVDKGSIKIKLMCPKNHEDVASVRMDIERKGEKEEIKYTRKESKGDGHFTDRIFVCAYGGARVLNATEDFERYRAIDAVYNLFQYSTVLQNPELIIRRVEDWGGDRDELLSSLNKLLMLPEGAINLGKTGLELKGPWKSSTQLKVLGDGYRSIINWVSDLIGWSIYYYDELVKPEDLFGIVLLDEIELNLHPKWQRKIINLLHEQFPNLQFFVSSHSAVCTLGLTDIEDECESKIFVFDYSSEGVVATETQVSTARQRLDRILTSTLFQLQSVSDDATDNMILELAAMPSSDDERSSEIVEKEKDLIAKINASIAGTTVDKGDVIGKAFSTGLEDQLMRVMGKHSLDKVQETIDKVEIKRKLSGI